MISYQKIEDRERYLIFNYFLHVKYFSIAEKLVFPMKIKIIYNFYNYYLILQYINMEQDDDERCLNLIQQLYQEGLINDAQRDALKDMFFDEDAILLSFFQRYADPVEEEDLKTEVIKYVSGGNFGQQPE